MLAGSIYLRGAMLPSSQSPLNNIGGDPRNRVILACLGSNVGSAPVVAKFDRLTTLLDEANLDVGHRFECTDRLASIFQNFVQSGNWKALEEFSFDRGLYGDTIWARLEIGSELSQLLTLSRVSVREKSFREQITLGCLKELFTSPLQPGVGAVEEMQVFLKNAPAFVDRIIEFERLRADLPENANLSPQDLRFVYRADEIAISNLKLMIENGMPASVMMKVTESLVLIKKQSARDEVVDMWKWFAQSSICSSTYEENRLPEPVGRAALIGALKERDGSFRRNEPQGKLVVHQLPTALPSNPAHWKYFAQRLTYLSAIKDEDVRDLRMSAYVVSFREFAASHSFYQEEERHFRRINLDGVSAPESLRFYSGTYGVDNGPGPEGSDLAEKPLRETGRAFRIMAAARYGLNIRKGYTRTLRSSGKWLLEHMAEELSGSSARYKYGDIEAYPGSGVRMWDLDMRNALDLSTPQSRLETLKASPWIAASLRVGREVQYHLTRGFIAISRTIDATNQPMSKTWKEKGAYNGEPYSPIIFNDHFHNDRLPEVRMWLVPERALLRKLRWAIENNVDINKLDMTPEGLAEEADAFDLPIFDVGCSCVRWGSYANAWPHGEGPANEWERTSEWAHSRWQSPRHIHRAMSGEQYSEHLRVDVGRTMAAARVEHDKIKHMVDFFLDLHSSFLTMEESWAKEYSSAGEGPARLEPQQEAPANDTHAPQGSENESNDGLDLNDFKVRPSRTRILEHFLALRNQIVSNRRSITANDIPSLELQYTRLFSRQDKTAYISGSDMHMVLPDGRKLSLLGGKAQPGELFPKVVEMSERIEALWVQHIVSEFAPNNCPRIILP